ncbi:MAG: hypothetical protein ACRD6X_03385 [Pyrinomonadaceae bacterium]
MSITITVSKETEQKIKKRAARIGKDVDKVVGDLVEEVWDEHFPGEVTSDPNNSTKPEEYENPFTPFIGMFSSGKTDTSVRYKEILREAIDMPGGFNND